MGRVSSGRMLRACRKESEKMRWRGVSRDSRDMTWRGVKRESEDGGQEDNKDGRVYESLNSFKLLYILRAIRRIGGLGRWGNGGFTTRRRVI